MTARRFLDALVCRRGLSKTWSVKDMGACFAVRSSGQKLPYVLLRGEVWRATGGQTVFSTDLRATPPLHECAASWGVLRQDQNKCIGDCVGVCVCEADAGSTKIEDSARPKQGTLYSNPGIIVVTVTGRSTAITVEIGAAVDHKSQASLFQAPGRQGPTPVTVNLLTRECSGADVVFSVVTSRR